MPHRRDLREILRVDRGAGLGEVALQVGDVVTHQLQQLRVAAEQRRLDRPTAEAGPHHLQQRVTLHRFGEVVRAARIQASLLVSLQSAGGQRHNRARHPGLAELPRGAVPVEHRHLHVHQNQIKPAVTLRQLHALPAIIGGLHLAAGPLQQQPDQLPVRRPIVDHQHPRRDRRFRLARRLRRRRIALSFGASHPRHLGDRPRIDRHDHPRAKAQPAFHAQLAA